MMAVSKTHSSALPNHYTRLGVSLECSAMFRRQLRVLEVCVLKKLKAAELSLRSALLAFFLPRPKRKPSWQTTLNWLRWESSQGPSGEEKTKRHSVVYIDH